ncbi:enoyl-CoA hydratase/isomerase family protein [Paenisporosarcina cavernae]|uniref:Ethylmalonyl-CoA decarboxylase n=1 Tax=Paenisporosarcina cavernae TaxID=2320858 RepID=A0A385YTZ7_9BACL|nr:enoyl-CoA hydratase/isomerase family protein [Paenisporosarcina cavernae]AYC29148.1 enoyl-CoA hydratase/isomerase family protein [Paenisporosarcina cavernae]
MSYSISTIHNCLLFTIQREERRNAIDFDVMEGLREFALRLHEDTRISAGIITGSGNQAFCSGGDLQVFHALETEAEARSMLQPMSEILVQLAIVPVPTIALVNGHAVGGGCEIATMCDFRVMHETAKAGFIQGSLAITTGWGGATYLFDKLADPQKAFKVLLEAKPYDAKTLHAIGWANDLYTGEKEEALERIVRQYVSSHPSVMRAYKSRRLDQLNIQTLKGQIEREVNDCARLWEQPAHHEAVAKFLSKKSK